MSDESNPYSPSMDVGISPEGIQKVRIQPIKTISRGLEATGGQYWLFMGICLVAVFIGSMVPMGLIMGAMMVGVYLCFIEKEKTGNVEFGTLFKGFEQFLDSFVVTIIAMITSMIVMAPFMIGLIIAVAAPIFQNMPQPGQPAPANPPDFPVVTFLVLYPLTLMSSILAYMPFMFTFQLIADRQLSAMESIALSFKGVVRNFVPIVVLMFVLFFITMILAMMCYLPALLFMPISFGAMFTLYRDIYGPAQPRGEPSLI